MGKEANAEGAVEFNSDLFEQTELNDLKGLMTDGLMMDIFHFMVTKIYGPLGGYYWTVKVRALKDAWAKVRDGCCNSDFCAFQDGSESEFFCTFCTWMNIFSNPRLSNT